MDQIVRYLRVKNYKYEYQFEKASRKFKYYTARFLKHNMKDFIEPSSINAVKYYDAFIHFIFNVYSKKLNLNTTLLYDNDYSFYNNNDSPIEIIKKLQITEDDYKSDDIVSMEHWAVDYWRFLHYLTFMVYDDEILKSELAVAMKCFYYLLKCSVCVNNYKYKNIDIILSLPIKHGDPITAMYDFHLKTNAMLFDSYIMSFEEFQKEYECKLIKKEYVVIKI